MKLNKEWRRQKGSMRTVYVIYVQCAIIVHRIYMYSLAHKTSQPGIWDIHIAIYLKHESSFYKNNFSFCMYKVHILLNWIIQEEYIYMYITRFISIYALYAGIFIKWLLSRMSYPVANIRPNQRQTCHRSTQSNQI